MKSLPQNKLFLAILVSAAFGLSACWQHPQKNHERFGDQRFFSRASEALSLSMEQEDKFKSVLTKLEALHSSHDKMRIEWKSLLLASEFNISNAEATLNSHSKTAEKEILDTLRTYDSFFRGLKKDQKEELNKLVKRHQRGD